MSEPKPKKKQGKYYQVTDGEWIKVPWRGAKDQCCDCGLVHRVNYRLDDRGGLEVQVHRHSRATNAARIHFKFTKEED